MKSKTIGVRIYVKLYDVACLLDSASRSSAYWAQGVEELAYDSIIVGVLNGSQVVKIKLLDDDLNGKERGFILDMKRIKKGLAIMAKKYPKDFCDILADEADGNTADVFLQCALLGETVYG